MVTLLAHDAVLTFVAHEAVKTLLAQEAVPNKLPVKEEALTDEDTHNLKLTGL